MRIYLTTQLNVTDNDQIDLFIDEGFDSFIAFARFIDTDIHNLISSLKKPGGTIMKPANSNKTINYSGSTVKNTTEIYLKVTCHTSKYYVSLSRPSI